MIGASWRKAGIIFIDDSRAIPEKIGEKRISGKNYGSRRSLSYRNSQFDRSCAPQLYSISFFLLS